jgi:uncharacterized repeat protein (TIGR03803 family)
MSLRNLTAGRGASLALLLIHFFLGAAWAQTESLLHSFTGATADGSAPYAGLISDSKGNFYGTTVSGGSSTNCTNGCGTLFKITSLGKEIIVHSFVGGSTDGAGPYASLVIDKNGNLYGSTSTGGKNGSGIVFKISPTGSETILYSFGTPLSGDGSSPRGNLVQDGAGNLYGTTFEGGTHYQGTIFKLTPSGTESILHSFSGGSGADGAYPAGGLVRDASGNLYGTTYQGGINGLGTIFELSEAGTETVLYSFAGENDGEYPEGTLVLDTQGNLYGTTEGGGKPEDGTVFRFAPATGTETVLYSFGDQAGDGVQPFAGVILDAKNNVYGTTTAGGNFGAGTAYRVTPSGIETVLYSFGNTGDGRYPYGRLMLDAKGDLYGTTVTGGPNTLGTVFRIVP